REHATERGGRGAWLVGGPRFPPPPGKVFGKFSPARRPKEPHHAPAGGYARDFRSYPPPPPVPPGVLPAYGPGELPERGHQHDDGNERPAAPAQPSGYGAGRHQLHAADRRRPDDPQLHPAAAGEWRL